MSDEQKAAIHLPFSDKYTDAHSREYFEKHHRKKLSDRLEHRMAARALALAGNPASVLDLPCGTGRFWSMLAADPQRELFAADYSQAMLELAEKPREPGGVRRFRLLRCLPFAITLPDYSVDCIFSVQHRQGIGESIDKPFGRRPHFDG